MLLEITLLEALWPGFRCRLGEGGEGPWEQWCPWAPTLDEQVAIGCSYTGVVVSYGVCTMWWMLCINDAVPQVAWHSVVSVVVVQCWYILMHTAEERPVRAAWRGWLPISIDTLLMLAESRVCA